MSAGVEPSAARRLAGPLLLLLVGAAGVWASLAVGVGSARQPGPGMWPLLAAIVFTVAAGVRVLGSVRVRDLVPVEVTDLMRIGVGLALTCAFVLMFVYVGLAVTVAVFFLCWMRILGKFDWLPTILYTALFATIFYLIFTVILHIDFPLTIFSLI